MSGYRQFFPEGTTERMRELMKTAHTASELKRIQCILFRSEYDFPPDQIARLTGFNVGTIYNLHSAFIRQGEPALEIEKKGGRYHSHLSKEEESAFLEEFKKSGEAGNILEVSSIKKALENKLGKKIGKTTVYEMLHRHGWREITPRPRHPRANAEVAESFKKTLETS